MEGEAETEEPVAPLLLLLLALFEAAGAAASAVVRVGVAGLEEEDSRAKGPAASSEIVESDRRSMKRAIGIKAVRSAKQTRSLSAEESLTKELVRF